jgi:hypothetical protein
MKEKNGIVEELRSIGSPLADMSRRTPYRVPEGYFEIIANGIIDHIKLAEGDDPVLPYSKAMPYRVPQGYFEHFEEELRSRLDDVVVLPKNIPLTAPAGYFENLPGQILSRIHKEEKPQQKPKLIPFVGAELWRQLRWAAAAILLLGIGLGIAQLYINPQPVNVDIALAKVSKTELNNYVEANIDQFDTDMIAPNLTTSDVAALDKQLSDDEITRYLDEMGGWDQTETE